MLSRINFQLCFFHLNLLKRNKVAEEIYEWVARTIRHEERWHTHIAIRAGCARHPKMWTIWMPPPYVTWCMRSFVFICASCLSACLLSICTPIPLNIQKNSPFPCSQQPTTSVSFESKAKMLFLYIKCWNNLRPCKFVRGNCFGSDHMRWHYIFFSFGNEITGDEIPHAHYFLWQVSGPPNLPKMNFCR